MRVKGFSEFPLFIDEDINEQKKKKDPPLITKP